MRDKLLPHHISSNKYRFHYTLFRLQSMILTQVTFNLSVNKTK